MFSRLRRSYGADSRINVWVREHYADVFRFCARRIGDDRAEDATQESFVIAHQTLARYDEATSPRTWLFGIANNVCRNLARRYRREFLVPDLVLMEQAAEPVAFDVAMLKQALGRLSDEHREVIVLHEVEGLRYGEIAAVLGVPEGTVKSRLHHAILKMREQLCEGAIR
ncbi:MAG: ECF RNA polymerase sigma factor SigL [Fimbriimonadaceae bacterium]|nr:ECF RNA polymerase sigma factor SigL [Fimbriimonadaceae bacterium]